MYIEQLLAKKNNLILYLPIPGFFFFLMFINYIFSQGQDVSEVMKTTIATFGTNLTFVMIIMPLAIGFFVVLGWVKLLHRQSITSLTTARPKIDWQRIFLSFFIWSSITIISTAVVFLMNPNDYELNYDATKFFPFLILAILLIPLQTSFEEYLFRGYLMQGIGLATNTRWIPFVVTSILFGLLHIANPEVEKMGFIVMLYYIGTGFFLGAITLLDDGIELALGFHAANNLIGALLLTADWTAFQTHSILKDVSEPSAGFDVLLPVFIIFPLLLVIFGKVYKWTNWKQKLFGKLTPVSHQ